MKYAEDLVLLAKEEAVLQSMFAGLIGIGRCYGMEKECGTCRVMSISRESSPLQMVAW
jgi:hypothetical protein